MTILNTNMNTNALSHSSFFCTTDHLISVNYLYNVSNNAETFSETLKRVGKQIRTQISFPNIPYENLELMQRHIQNIMSYLRWNFLRKQLTTLSL